MEEIGRPTPLPEDSTTSKKDEKSKKKTRDAAGLGGLAATESLIWQRPEHETEAAKEKERSLFAKPKPAAEEQPRFAHEIQVEEDAEIERAGELTPDESRQAA